MRNKSPEVTNLISNQSKTVLEAFVMTVWQIWKERNDRVWNGMSRMSAHTVFVAATTLKEWYEARTASTVSDQLGSRSNIAAEESRGRCQAWHNPMAGYLKINVDAAFFEDSNQTGLGMVIRDEDGTFILARTKLMSGRQDTEIGEAMGFFEALSWIMELNFEKVLIEGDAKLVVDVIYSTTRSESFFGDYIQACKTILQHNPEFKVKFVRRHANQLAHEFVRVSRDFGNSFCWLDPPTFVDGLVNVACMCNNEN